MRFLGPYPVWLGVILLALYIGSAMAQPDSAVADDTTRISWNGLCKAGAFTGAYYASAMLVMQNVWYRDQELVPFHFFNDNQGYLQVDKFGHAFGAYVESYYGYRWLRNAGVNKSSAILYGATLGFVLQTPIELMDGIHEGWGFSWGDMVANALGSSLVIGQELLLGEQVILCKFSYWESSYARDANGYLGETSLEKLLEDYNGHTYWLSVPLRSIARSTRIPRWLNVAVGYSANGMFGEFENIKVYQGTTIPGATRYRQALLSLDIDWRKIETDSKILRALLRGVTLVKLPFPALELNSRGGFRGYWLYY